MPNTHAHTPGPWTLINGSTIGLVIKDSAGHTVLSESQGLRNKEHAALIAAAPSLLQELEESTQWLEIVLSDVELPDMSRAYLIKRIEANRAAIAKATQGDNKGVTR